MEPPVLLDLTRLFSRRTSFHDTGIDRVERGYFHYFKKNPSNRFLVYGGQGRYYFFDGDGAKKALEIGDHSKIGTHLRLANFAYARSSFFLLEKKMESFASYINVGHSDYKRYFYQALKKARLKSIFMIHDVIPLDYPEFTRKDQIMRFRRKFENWTIYADVLIAPSAYSARRIAAWNKQSTKTIIAPLAIEMKHDCVNIPEKNAYLILGTIEPRKNHMTIFKVWELLFAELGDDCPELWLVGARGWDIESEIAFLESSPLIGKKIREFGAVQDEELSRLFCACRAIVFPSFVEGFGLPVYEASLSNKPFIASKIDAFTEIEGIAKERLVEPLDVDSWLQSIKCKPIVEKIRANDDWRVHIEHIQKLV